MSKLVLIDLREETEIEDTKILPNSKGVTVINIPTRNIFANVNYINALSEEHGLIYLICRSGVRSENVKTTYFPHNPRIQSYLGGWKALEKSDDRPNVSIKHSYSLFNMGPQQYMQTVIVLFLVGAIVMNYMNIAKKYINIYLGSMAVFIMYQILTKSCLMTSYIPLVNLVN